MEKYAQTVVQVAKEKSLVYLNLFELMKKVGDDYKAYLSDGLHFNTKGNAFLFKELIALIDKEIPELSEHKLNIPFPDWTQLISNK